MWTASRRRLGSFAAESFFRGAAQLGALHPDADPARHGVQKRADIPYVDDGNPAHLLDIYVPSGPGPHPVVLYVHGGGFRILSKDTHWLMALAFARRGYLVFNIGYRLAGEAPYPAAVEDTCAAYRWVRANAASFGGDPERMVIAGESAGANLATALTIALCWRRPEPFAAATFDAGAAPLAVVPACGVFQVSDIERLQRRKPHMSSFIADRLVEVRDAYLAGHPDGPGHPSLDLADPLVFLERDLPPDRPLPAFFLPVGTKDPLLPDTRRLGEVLERRGAPVEVRYYPGEIHAFHAFVFRENARKCWEDTWRFLDACQSGVRSPSEARTGESLVRETRTRTYGPESGGGGAGTPDNRNRA